MNNDDEIIAINLDGDVELDTEKEDSIKNVVEEYEKIKIPDWDLIPPFDTVDRSKL